MSRTGTAICLLVLAAGGLRAAPTATAVAHERRNVVVNDPANPAGMQIRRARPADEPWPAYFCEVFLWPYSAEHYNRIFTTMNQHGRRVQFIGNTVFATGDRWYLVLRGTREMVALMGKNVVLESGGHGPRQQPVETILREDPAGDAWVGLVAFARPSRPQPRVMSSFGLYGNAGGVHEVRDEEQARRHFAVLRDLVEFIERIHREEQRQGR